MSHPLEDGIVYDSEKLAAIADQFNALAALAQAAEVNVADENLTQEQKNEKSAIILPAITALVNLLKAELSDLGFTS